MVFRLPGLDTLQEPACRSQDVLSAHGAVWDHERAARPELVEAQDGRDEGVGGAVRVDTGDLGSGLHPGLHSAVDV